ncbi:MAG: DUF4386 domain-containing protein [candidate division Zixibacteria bacterium]|nr:DUF4386 domain-containing protein [candidate division Zixibacteria bacterium]
MPLQMAFGLIVPFVLLQGPLSTAAPGFLVNAAASSLQIRLAVLIAFVGAALTVAIAITAYPVIRRYSQTLALWFLALCTASLVMDAIHNATVLAMLSLSERYTEPGAVDAGLFPAIGAAVRTIRYWAHYTQLIFIGGWIIMFYGILWRYTLIPRALAILGVTGIILQFTGVTLPAYLNYPSVNWMAMPLAPIHLTVAIWLMVKGFNERVAG